MKLSIAITLLLLILSCGVLPAQKKEKTAVQIQDLVQQYYQNKKFNGSVLVAKEGKIIYAGGFGYASTTKNDKNTENTKFLIGSATKSFTAIAVLQCVQQGLLNLHAPIQNYLPELSNKVGSLTLHHLMKNSSGLPVHLNRVTQLEYRDISSTELLDIYSQLELSFTPGSRFEYSNLNYQLCALIVERISQLSYKQYLQKFIFNQLQMDSSGVQRTTDTIPDRALGYQVENQDLLPAPKNYLAYAMGGGDIYSTVLDLLKWDQSLYDEDLLNTKSKELLFDGNPEKYGGYGYGFKVKGYARKHGKIGKLVRHGGSMYGFVCNIHRYLDDKVTIIILGNIRPYPVMEITTKIEKLLLTNNLFD